MAMSRNRSSQAAYRSKYYSRSRYSGRPHVADIPVYIFDSETTADPHHLCEELGLDQAATNAEIQEAFHALTEIQRNGLQQKLDRLRRRLAWRPKAERKQAVRQLHNKHKEGLPFSPWALQAARIVSVSRLMLTVDQSDPYHNKIMDITFCGVETLMFDPQDESITLAQVVEETNAIQPIVVGWNTKGYDIPVIINRSSVPSYGLDTPDYLLSITQTKPSSALGRRNVDVMKRWAGGGTRYAGLDAAARAMGGAGKMGKSGSGVLEMFLKEEYGDIAAYCECDVLNTLYVYIVWLRNQGRLYDDKVYNRFIDQKVAYLKEQAKKSRPHLADYLRQWKRNSKGRLKIRARRRA